MKRILFTAIAICILMTSFYLPAEIIKTAEIEDILPAIEPDTLVLFNIAEVLMDT